jgi:hypothetical protein
VRVFAWGVAVRKWDTRWFVLKSNHCLYYYKSPDAERVLGIVPLADVVCLVARFRCFVLSMMREKITHASVLCCVAQRIAVDLFGRRSTRYVIKIEPLASAAAMQVTRANLLVVFVSTEILHTKSRSFVVFLDCQNEIRCRCTERKAGVSHCNFFFGDIKTTVVLHAAQCFSLSGKSKDECHQWAQRLQSCAGRSGLSPHASVVDRSHCSDLLFDSSFR